ncbi:MAG: NAD-dependent epimerase/dehydratase family protein [Nitrosotalea sp.]
MKILITGSGGFIGRHLSNRLAETENEIIGLCRKKTNPTIKEISGDINDEKVLAKLVPKTDVIIHLAAYLDVKESFSRLNEVFTTNIQGTFGILKAISLIKRKPHFIFLSSSTVYGNTTKIPIKETHQLDPFTPYSMSKATCEMMCKGFTNSHEIPMTIMRPFSVYGPDGPTHQAIPRIIRQLKSSNIIIQDNPDEVRDFVYVDDVVDAIVKAMQKKPSKLKIYNIGSGKGTTMMNATKTIAKLFPKKITIKHGIISELNKKKSTSDISLIKTELGWRPKTTLIDGLRLTLKNDIFI